jgi:hypothetical protein
MRSQFPQERPDLNRSAFFKADFPSQHAASAPLQAHSPLDKTAFFARLDDHVAEQERPKRGKTCSAKVNGPVFIKAAALIL